MAKSKGDLLEAVVVTTVPVIVAVLLKEATEGIKSYFKDRRKKKDNSDDIVITPRQ